MPEATNLPLMPLLERVCADASVGRLLALRGEEGLVDVAAASGLLLGGTAVAHADFLPTALPGTGGPSTVIKTDNTDVKVTVGKVNAEAGTVDVSLTNTSANAYTCNVSKEANTVTEAALVDQAMAYYAGNVYPGAGGGLVDTGSLTAIYLAVIVAAIGQNLTYAPLAAYLAELFAPRVRMSGASLAYQLAAITVSGATPFIMTAIIAQTGATTGVSVYITVMALLTLGSALALPETNPRAVREDPRAVPGVHLY